MSIVARCHFCYSLAIIFNIVTMVVYWTFIHAESVIEFKENAIMLVQLTCVHSVVGICGAINTALTNFVLCKELLKRIQIIAIFYLTVNFIQV
jgi:hypothetical protein